MAGLSLSGLGDHTASEILLPGPGHLLLEVERADLKRGSVILLGTAVHLEAHSLAALSGQGNMSLCGGAEVRSDPRPKDLERGGCDSLVDLWE